MTSQQSYSCVFGLTFTAIFIVLFIPERDFRLTPRFSATLHAANLPAKSDQTLTSLQQHQCIGRQHQTLTATLHKAPAVIALLAIADRGDHKLVVLAA